jgi:hypothetical protein
VLGGRGGIELGQCASLDPSGVSGGVSITTCETASNKMMESLSWRTLVAMKSFSWAGVIDEEQGADAWLSTLAMERHCPTLTPSEERGALADMNLHKLKPYIPERHGHDLRCSSANRVPGQWIGRIFQASNATGGHAVVHSLRKHHGTATDYLHRRYAVQSPSLLRILNTRCMTHDCLLPFVYLSLHVAT